MVALVAWSQLVYLGLLAVCVVIDPAPVTHRDEGGISNFGIHAPTVLAYTGAFAGAAVLLAMAAGAAPATALAARFATWCRVLALALGCVLVSTYGYKHGATLHALHIAVSVAATVVEVALGVWVVAVARDGVAAAALVVLLAAAALGAVTLAGGAHVLFVAQAVGAVAFAVVLVRGAVVVVSGDGVDAARG